MLVISRRVNESLLLGDDIRVTVLEAGSEQVRLGIEAPRSVTVLRQELAEEVRRRNVAASRVRSDDLAEMSRRLGSRQTFSVALCVADRMKAVDFYRKALGFRSIPGGPRALPGALRLNLGDTNLWIYEAPHEETGGGAFLTLPVADPAAAHKQALSFGAKDCPGPFPGALAVADPNGYRFLLVRE